MDIFCKVDHVPKIQKHHEYIPLTLNEDTRHKSMFSVCYPATGSYLAEGHHNGLDDRSGFATGDFSCHFVVGLEDREVLYMCAHKRLVDVLGRHSKKLKEVGSEEESKGKDSEDEFTIHTRNQAGLSNQNNEFYLEQRTRPLNSNSIFHLSAL